MDRRNFLKSTGGSLMAALLPIQILAATIDEPVAIAIARIADQAIKNLVTPGIQISVWRNGISTVKFAGGLSNLETNTAVTPSTIFRAGSITKQFTSALIAKLQDMGQLAVNDPVAKYLPFFKGKATATVLELIHHTAGIHQEPDNDLFQSHVSQLDLAQLIANQSQLLDFNPGTAWLYSNANYILLGAIVESITNQSLAEAASQLIFEPLGLINTAFDSSAEIIKSRASGYTATENNTIPFTNAEFLPIEQTGGAGAIRTTAEDLCKWHHTLFYGPFLSTAARAELIKPANLKDGRPVTAGRFDPNDNNMGETSYGYGLMLDRSVKNHDIIAMHNGFVSGFSAYLATHLPTKTTIACMCNADPSQKLPFRLLRKAVFADYL